MSEKSEAKYAAEAFELFRLFDRIGRSFYGLLLLEIGWLLILILAAKLTGEKAGPPMLAVPMPTVIGPPYLRFEDVRITAVSVVGGILIFAGWVFYSRLHHYLVVPFALLLRLGLKWLSIAAFFLIFILETPVTLLLGQWFLRREMQKEKIEWIKKFKHSHPDQDGEMAYAQHVKNLQNKHGDKILVQRALEKVVIKKGILGDMAAIVLSALLKKLQSPGRIGIAPLVSYTYAEDFHGERYNFRYSRLQ